jgi:hypothetical protein
VTRKPRSVNSAPGTPPRSARLRYMIQFRTLLNGRLPPTESSDSLSAARSIVDAREPHEVDGELLSLVALTVW